MRFRTPHPPYLFLQLQFKKSGKYAQADTAEMDGGSQ